MSGIARQRLREALAAALSAVDPREATARWLRAHPLDASVHVIALGKAAIGMTRGALDACGVVSGIVVAPQERGELLPLVRVLRGRHPVPDAEAGSRGNALLRFATELPQDAHVIVLLSGGGSALADAPKEGVSTDALAAVNARLLACGASIDETNTVRASLSRLKAGGLASALAPRATRALVISDVPGHDASIVASGPMSRWRGPSLDAVLGRPHLHGVLPEALRALASITASAEDAPLEVVADNARAVRAAATALEESGLVVAIGAPLVGEARDRGAALAREVAAARADALVAGGETTVTLRGGGRGGRNQELALAALVAGIDGTLLTAATDGVDGASEAAGAFVDDDTRMAAAAASLDAAAALDANDSGTFFARAGSALVTGPTGTNVADLVLWLRGSR